MFIVRVTVLTLRIDDVYLQSFPPDCSGWAKDDGCTRITRLADQCVRPMTIPNSYSMYYKLQYSVGEQGMTIAQILKRCMENISFNNKVFPQSEVDDKAIFAFVHLLVQTTFWGFIDDMYIFMNNKFG